MSVSVCDRLCDRRLPINDCEDIVSEKWIDDDDDGDESMIIWCEDALTCAAVTIAEAQ